MAKRLHSSLSSNGSYELPFSQLQHLVELLDVYGRPFMLTPLTLAPSLGLLYRVALTCFKNIQGQVFLQRRPENSTLYAGLWDVSAVGRVFAGESPEDTARRELEEQLGIEMTRLRTIGSLPYTDSNGTNLSATFFLAGPSSALPKLKNSASDGMFVDAFELIGLVAHQQNMFTPELIWAIQSGWIFPR